MDQAHHMALHDLLFPREDIQKQIHQQIGHTIFFRTIPEPYMLVCLHITLILFQDQPIKNKKINFI